MLSTEKLFVIYMEWLKGGPIWPSIFPHNGWDEADCSGEFDCLDSGRLLVFFAGIHIIMILLTTAFSERFSFYRRMNMSTKIQWVSNTLSLVHAFVASYGAFKHIINTDYFDESVFRYHVPYNFYASYSLAYFLVDFAIVIIRFSSHKDYSPGGMVVHHMIGIIANYCSVLAPGHYILGMWMFTELSTVFVDLRFILDVTGYRQSRLYFINGLLIVASFFVIRIVVVNVLFWPHFYHSQQELFESLGTFLGWFVDLGAITLTSLNVVWMIQIWNGAMKALFGRGGKDKKGATNDSQEQQAKKTQTKKDE